MFTYACLRDTHSSSSHYLTHNGNDLCLENKDTVTQNHSHALSLWHQHTTHPCRDACDRHTGRFGTRGGVNNKEHNSGGWLTGSDCAIALARLLITLKSVFQASWPFQNIPAWQQTCNYTIIVHYHHAEHLSNLTMKTTSGCVPWSGLTTWPVLSSAAVLFLLTRSSSRSPEVCFLEPRC